MSGMLDSADRLLRGTGPFAPRAERAPPPRPLAMQVIAFGLIYGAVMGTYEFHWPGRVLQMIFSAVKVPVLLFATSAVCLPGFSVLNTVMGLRDDLRRAIGALFAGQAAMSVVLASFAPLTAFFYLSVQSYRAALLFNLFAFGAATVAGQLVIWRHYRTLIAGNRTHRWMLAAWLLLYSFVGIQMGWMFRPFIGAPNMPTTFFRAEPFTNAYVVVAQLLLGR